MNQAVSARPAPMVPPHKRPLFTRLLSVLFVSLFLSVLMELVGLLFIWPEEGALHSARMLEQEVGYLNQDFTQGILNYSPVVTIMYLSQQAYYWCFQFTHIETLLMYMGNRIGIFPYIHAVTNVIQLFFVRLLILTFSMPLFIVFAAVGGATGLSFRDIRRWSGGREFGRLFHHAKKMIPATLFLSWIVYLSLPVSLHPNMIILPCAVLFAGNLMIMSASYKKYL